MATRVFCVVICVLPWMLPALSADEAAPAGEASVEDFLGLLEKLQSDPSSRDSVSKILTERLEAVRREASEAQPLIDDVAGKVTSAQTQSADLRARVDALSKELEAEKAKLDAIAGQLPALNEQLEAAKKNQAAIAEKISVYERSLQLMGALPAETPATGVSPAPASAVPTVDPADRVNFNRDIRPILANNCFACHGPDDQTRKAGLRLDTEEGATAALKSGGAPIVPGDKAASEVFKRITAADPSDKMPPADFGKTLTQQQIDLLGKWMDQGGKYEKHWAFEAPKRAPLPEVSRKDWVKNELDYFILARLEREGLEPSPEADRRTLARRVTLDLTGLPPAPAEVEAFVNDTSPDAYEKLVDRLLASPHYGEQMARTWLDLARYADTNGYHIDNIRYMWRWRDWVIDAYNRNLPFDQFTIQQLAGDLLPEPSLDQLIATGFNRNHMITFEGGIIPEEYRVQYVVDRLNTTGTAWMGLTIGCAQCHDHKFDPISNKNFYEMFAFFNTVNESGSDGREGNAVPLIKAPLPEQHRRMDELKGAIDAVLAKMSAPLPEMDAAQAAWEAESITTAQARWATLEPESSVSTGGATMTSREDHSIWVEGTNPDKDIYEISAATKATGITAIRIEALEDSALSNGGPGRSENGNFVLTEFEAEISPADNPELKQKVTFSTAASDFAQANFDAVKTIDGNPETGWGVQGGDKGGHTLVLVPDRPFGFDVGTRIHMRLRQESPFAQHALGSFRISVTSEPTMAPSVLGPWFISGPFVAAEGKAAYETAFDPEKGVDLAATYDDQRAKWVQQIQPTDGTVQELSGNVAATYFFRTITAPSARVMTLSMGSNDAIKVWLNEQVVHDKNVQRGVTPDEDKVSVQLNPGKNRLLVKVVNYGNAYAYYFRRADEEVGDIPLALERALVTPAATRTDKQMAAIRDYFRSRNWTEWAPLSTELAALRDQERALDAEIPTTMIMQEMAEPRETFVLARGQYDQPKDRVTAAVPAALPPLPAAAPANRLGFAQWLVDPSHPLTARVTVNRFWMHYFGAGIVKTAEDFGVQGEWPTHPELLDWMATEFIRTGWNVKAMQRLIVTSATYRQESKVRPAIHERDPENRLLARGPRFRMDGEMVRDNALAISRLLVSTIGGPSVKPYQPAGLWEEVSYGGTEFTGQVFEQDHGEALYRRSMYTFWKRQSPPPGMLIFDAPNREICTARRARTNTPLQALALLNDTQFVEASRVLAERMLREAGPEPEARVTYAFEWATARKPKAEECAILTKLYDEQVAAYRQDPEAAKALLSVGERPCDASLDPPELAAWSTVASVILNLDETLTKS